MTEKGGTFGMDRVNDFGDLRGNSLSVDKMGLQPLNPNKLSSATEAKMDYWKGEVKEKWDVFHEKDRKYPNDHEIEKNSKVKILESILEKLHTLSLNLTSEELKEEIQKEISDFYEKVEKMKNDPLDPDSDFKNLEKLKDNIHKFYDNNF